MSIKKQIGCGLAIVLVAAIQSARGADGRPNQDTLSQMGLSGLVTMNDTEAESVRGLGFKSSSAQANGSSYANYSSQNGNAHSENSYSSDGNHYASGNNESHAGVKNNSGNGGNWGGNGNGNGGNGNGGNYPGCNNRYCGNNGGNNAGCNNRYCGSNGGGYGGGGRNCGPSVTVFAGGSSSARAH